MTHAERFYEWVRRVPPGTVASYGDIAWLAGLPRAAREVGWALGRLPEGHGLPWWRVIRADGTLPGHAGSGLQAELLRAEGVPVSADGRVDMARCRWSPPETCSG